MPDPDNIPYVSTVKRLLDLNDITDVPVIGGLYGAGNTVIDYFESDCHPDWYVYVETLFPALGEAVLVLLSFGLDDVLRGYFRPAGGRGFGGLGRSSRRQKTPTRAQRARGKLKGGIPEIGEQIGKHLPGATTVQARRVGSAEKFLWKVDGLAQRGLFYWMIADIADDFAINWTTGLYASEECRGLDVGGMVRSNTDVGIPLSSVFNTVILPDVEDEWGNISHTQQFVTLADGQRGHLTFNATVEEWNDTPSRVRLAVMSTGGLVLGTSGPASPDPTPPGSEFTATASIRGPGTFTWAAQSLDHLAVLTNPEAVCVIQGGPS